MQCRVITLDTTGTTYTFYEIEKLWPPVTRSTLLEVALYRWNVFRTTGFLNPFRTPFPFRGQTILTPSSVPPINCPQKETAVLKGLTQISSERRSWFEKWHRVRWGHGTIHRDAIWFSPKSFFGWGVELLHWGAPGRSWWTYIKERLQW